MHPYLIITRHQRLSGQTLSSAVDSRSLSFHLSGPWGIMQPIQPHIITYGFTEDRIPLSSGAVVEFNASRSRIWNTA